MRAPLLPLLLSLLCAGALGMYSSSDDVVELTDSSFRSEVLKDPGVVIVEFYAPWCGHCKNLAPEYKKAASALSGVVKVAAVDATEHGRNAQTYGVQGYPTLKIFSDGKDVTYEGARTAEGLIDAGLKAARQLVKSRTSGGASGGASGSKSKKSKESGGASKVVTLTDANFEEMVLNSDEAWMVEFYAPWCGHCKNLAPEWEDAALQLDGSVNLGAVDATVHERLASQYQIQGFPTIKTFQNGNVEDYQGGRTASDIVSFASRSLDSGPAVRQLTSQKQWNKKCSGKKICVLAALPHIMDSGKAGREEHLATLTKVAEDKRGTPFVFFWTEGAAQEALEQSLELTFGYPALAAVAPEKGRYAVQRGAFSDAAISKFLSGLTTGRERTQELPGKLKIAKVAEWDGLDAVVEEEEPLDPSFFDDL